MKTNLTKELRKSYNHLGILPLHKRTLVNVNKTINFYDLEHFGSKKTIVKCCHKLKLNRVYFKFLMENSLANQYKISLLNSPAVALGMIFIPRACPHFL